MGSWKCDPENSNLKGLPGGVPGVAGHTECGWDGSTHWEQKVLHVVTSMLRRQGSWISEG